MLYGTAPLLAILGGMAATLELTTTANVKLFRDWPSNAELNTWIDFAIAAVSERFERAIGRHLKAESRTEDVDVRDGQRIFQMRGYPIVAVTSIHNDGERLFAGTAIDSSEYAIHAATGQIEFDVSGLEPGPQVMRVLYQGGIATSTANVPDDLERAVIMQIVHEYDRRDTLGQTSSAVGDRAHAYDGPGGWITEMQEQIDTWKPWISA